MEIKEVIQTQLVIQNHCVDDFRLDVIYTSKHKFRVFVTQLSTSKQQMREIDCIFDVLWGSIKSTTIILWQPRRR